MERIEIEEIKKYVDELAAMLEQAGHKKPVAALREITERFKDPTEVRPAVYSLDQAVRQWLRTPGAMPDDAATRLTAQFLTDACKNALAQGAIRSMAPTPRDTARKLGRVATRALVVGVVVIVVPVGLLVVGVDWLKWVMPEEVHARQAERGKELVITATLTTGAPMPDALVTIRPVGECDGPAWDELSCEPSDRLWDDGIRHPTFHIVRSAEVHGILVAVQETRVAGGFGQGTLLVYADDNTAAGRYEIPLEALYFPPLPACVPDAGVADGGDSAGDGAGDGEIDALIQACLAAHQQQVVPLKSSAVSNVHVEVR